MKDVQPAQDGFFQYNFMHKLPQKMVVVVSIIENYFNGCVGTPDHIYEKSSKEKNSKSVYVCVHVCLQSL